MPAKRATKKAPAKTAAKKATKKKTSTKTAKKKATKKKSTRKKSKKSKENKTLSERRDDIAARYDRPVVIYEGADDGKPVFATRFPGLNGYLGGGLRGGSIVELYGPEDSAKTSLAIALAADIQARSPKGKQHVVFVNWERPYDFVWYRVLGMNTGKDFFTMLKPRSLEQGVAESVDLVNSGEVCAVIYDSIYAAAGKARRKQMETWGTESDKAGITAAMEAKLWGEAWTATKGIFDDEDVVVFAVNQIREVIDMGGGRGGKWAGKRTDTPRGRALKFYSHVRLELKGGFLLDDDGDPRRDVDGRRVKIKVIKNKTSGDARGNLHLDVIRGEGFDLVGDVISSALAAGVIDQKGGGNYQIGSKKVRGRAKLRKLFVDHPELAEKVSKLVQKRIIESTTSADEVSALIESSKDKATDDE